MSSMMNKISDALTGNHHTTTNTNNASNQAGQVGNNFADTAQVRDTGLTSATKHMNTNNTNSSSSQSSHLGRDAALATRGADLAGSQSSTTTTRREYEGSSDNVITRSEEHLLVGKEKVNVGKAALDKYVTTEKVSTAVPIIREHAVVEREPITEANRDQAFRGSDFKKSHYEVNLMEERAVAEKEEVPIERVRLRKEVEQTQQIVEAELRKEHVEVVDPTQTINTTMGTGSTGRTAVGSTSTANSNLSNSSRRL